MSYLMGSEEPDIIKLLEKGANINSKVYGITLLQLYINESNWKMVDQLTDKYKPEAI